MKLSMWLLQRRLADYHPTATITKGAQIIEGVRFYTNDSEQDERFLYISRVKDVYPDSSSSQILLMNGNDVISIDAPDVEVVYNRTMEAFEFYNDWERRLHDAASGETPEQAIIDVTDELLGPTFLMDSDLTLVAFSRRYARGEVNALWDSFIANGNTTLDTVDMMKQSAISKLQFRKHDCLVFEEPHAAPYSHGIMTSRLDARGNLTGQFVIASDEPIGPYELQLARFIEHSLADMRASAALSSSNSYAEALLARALTDDDLDSNDIGKLLIVQSWTQDCTFRVFRVDSQSVSEEYLNGYRQKLAAAFTDGVTVVVSGGIVGLFRVGEGENGEMPVAGLVAALNVRVGLSDSFRDLVEIPIRARQAADALAFRGLDERLCTFHRCGLHVITHASDRDYLLKSVHPAVLQLQDYDARGSTEYARTLRCFLQNERSCGKTAETMFVHRNTVLYRIKHVQKVCGIDLEDPYEREYLLTSFRVLD